MHCSGVRADCTGLSNIANDKFNRTITQNLINLDRTWLITLRKKTIFRIGYTVVSASKNATLSVRPHFISLTSGVTLADFSFLLCVLILVVDPRSAMSTDSHYADAQPGPNSTSWGGAVCFDFSDLTKRPQSKYFLMPPHIRSR